MPKKLIKSVIDHINGFLKIQAASGFVLLSCAVIAMVIANSGLGQSYETFLNTKLGFEIFGFSLKLSIQHWVNDALMVIFFFVVGMEIKYELVKGALASFDRAALPAFGALGGMIFPASIYFLIGPSGPAAAGWGIPMATDIAFAVGVLALLGKRVPTELKVFLLALAIADDLGAVIVIAIFYTASVSMAALGGALALSVLIWFLSRRGVKFMPLYLILGVGVWAGTLASGVHATIAGVILGFLMPTDGHPGGNGESPLEHWAHRLAPFSSFVIMPIFALSNAGVQVSGLTLEALFRDPIVSGVSYGLLIGKPIGITLLALLAVKLKIARLPQGVTVSQIFGVGMIAGIGFTMSLFVAGLAMKDPAHLDLAKIGIIKGSLTAAVLGSMILIFATRKRLVATR